MARKRRPKVLPPRDPTLAQAKQQTPHLDSMPRPNHNASLILHTEESRAQPHACRHPLVQLLLHEDQGGGLAFVDRLYGLAHWSDRHPDAPPTWMDPEIFVRQALEDDTVRDVLADCVASGEVAYQELVAQLERVFEDRHLVYLFERFGEVVQLLARWLVAHTAYEAAAPKTPRVRVRRPGQKT